MDINRIIEAWMVFVYTIWDLLFLGIGYHSDWYHEETFYRRFDKGTSGNIYLIQTHRQTIIV